MKFEIELPSEKPQLELKIDVEKFQKLSRSDVRIPNYINPQLAYLAGALRDGSISLTKTSIGDKCYVAFCNSSYGWLKEVIVPTLNSLFEIDVGNPFKDRDKWQIRIRKHSVFRFLADVLEHPIGKQTGWRTPKIFLSAPQEIQKWYIRGFFDSEGGCGNVIKLATKYPWQSRFPIRFFGGWNGNSCPPLEDISKMLKNFEISCSGNIRERKFVQGKIKTKVNMFCIKVKDAESKLKFQEKIGSSHPEKGSNLFRLCEMIVRQS